MSSFGMSPWFFLWIATTQCVNFAFYLAFTRVARGWSRTLGAYLVYLAALAAAIPLAPLIHGGAGGTAGALSVSFVSFFALWGAILMAMSRGARGRRFFSVVLCGVHQLIAFSASLLLLRHVRSPALGPLLASAVMALMGWFLVVWIRPRVERMPDNAGWTNLNVMAVFLFALLYADSIWPVYVADESFEHVMLFVLAALVAIVYFPMAQAFSEKSRLASSLATVEDNLRLMAGEMEDRREMVAEARQIRKDRRNHCKTLIDMLKRGEAGEALDCLRRLFDEFANVRTGDSGWCENETVNAILSGYSRKAEASGLRFSALASLGGPGALTEVEIVELVSNLLEVAIRTVCAKGELTCLLRQRKGSFGVTVTNTVSSDFRLTAEGLPFARLDTNLANVLGLVRRHRGHCRYRLNGARLTCEVLLAD